MPGLQCVSILLPALVEIAVIASVLIVMASEEWFFYFYPFLTAAAFCNGHTDSSLKTLGMSNSFIWSVCISFCGYLTVSHPFILSKRGGVYVLHLYSILIYGMEICLLVAIYHFFIAAIEYSLRVWRNLNLYFDTYHGITK